MIDDSTSERLTLEKAWPSATVLRFHFLQRRWTWLHDGKNGVTKHAERLVLIKKLQNMVYASNEQHLMHYYNELVERVPSIPVLCNTSDHFGRKGVRGHTATEQPYLYEATILTIMLKQESKYYELKPTISYKCFPLLLRSWRCTIKINF